MVEFIGRDPNGCGLEIQVPRLLSNELTHLCDSKVLELRRLDLDYEMRHCDIHLVGMLLASPAVGEKVIVFSAIQVKQNEVIDTIADLWNLYQSWSF